MSGVENPRRLNDRFRSKFPEVYQDQQRPEEGRREEQSKRFWDYNKDKDINSDREESLILNEFLTVIALCETKLENNHYLHSVMVNKLISNSFCWFKLDSHLLLYKYGLVSY